jgi:type II secretory pathway predicted ATPase ExeA
LSTEFSRMSRETAFVDETRSPLGFVLAARHATVAALIDGVMEGKAFLALSGPPGVGKTAVASAICEELTRRSVRVLQVRRGADAGISIRTIASQILDKPEAELHDDDIERLFDVMTARNPPDQGFALIIDDAECLQADALGYLRLLAILAKDTMPQVVFVGDSALWDSEHAAHSDLRGMITARWDLDGLSPDEAHGFIEQLVAPAAEAVFAPGGIEALIRRGDGSCGRIVALLSLARTLRAEQHDHWLSPTLIDAAAAKLDAGDPGPLEGDGRLRDADGGQADPGKSAPAPEATPDPVPVGASAEEEAIAPPSLWVRRVARMAGVTFVLFVIATVAGWQALVHISRTDARPAGINGADAVAATSQVIPPDMHAQAVSMPTSAEAEQPTAPAVASPAPVVATTDTPQAEPPVTPVAQVVTTTDGPTTPAITPSEPPAPTPQPQTPVAATPAVSIVTTTDAQTAPASTPPEPPAPSEEPQAPVAAVTTNTSTAPVIAPPEPPAPTVEPQAPVVPIPAAAAVTTTDAPAAPAIAPPEPPAATEEPQAPVPVAPAAPVANTTDTPTAPAPPEPPAQTAQPQVPVPAAPVAATTTDTLTAPATTPPEPPAPTAQPQMPVATPAAPVVTSTDLPTAPATTPPEPPSPTKQPEAPETATSATAVVAPKTSDAATPAQALTGAVSYPTAEPEAEPPKLAPAVPSSPRYVASDLALLLSRGDAMLALGDISAARRLYERAAALGSARAATAVGKTYDPVFLASIHATGISADRGVAAEWYRKGAALGDREGAAGLARLSRAQ